MRRYTDRNGRTFIDQGLGAIPVNTAGSRFAGQPGQVAAPWVTSPNSPGYFGAAQPFFNPWVPSPWVPNPWVPNVWNQPQILAPTPPRVVASRCLASEEQAGPSHTYLRSDGVYETSTVCCRDVQKYIGAGQYGTSQQCRVVTDPATAQTGTWGSPY